MYYLQKNEENILQFPAVNGKRRTGESNSRFMKVLWQYTYETLKLVLGIKAKQ